MIRIIIRENNVVLRAHFFYDAFIYNIVILCLKGDITQYTKQVLLKGIPMYLGKGATVEKPLYSCRSP